MGGSSLDNSHVVQFDMPDQSSLTHGHLLGERVRYAQPRDGFRSGIEPVLLAAAVPARPGDRVLEAGSGAGATLLCLAARVRGAQGIGVEQDAPLVALARENAAANGWPELHFIPGDIVTQSLTGAFDHACANPPYHPPEARVPPILHAMSRSGAPMDCSPCGRKRWLARYAHAAR